ncbi:MAG: alkaline phosphatase [Phycisphaerae bacterium]
MRSRSRRWTHRLAAVATALCGSAGAGGDGFSLGVAAGDVRDSSVILWTRADEPGMVRVEVALDEAFAALIAVGEQEAGAVTDQTVKFDVTGLAPATRYVYRFTRVADADQQSRVGRFRTAASASSAAPLRLIFSGDSNYAFAPFAAFGAAAREDADLFVWFGDVIYSDVPAGGLGAARTLGEYRARYRQLLGDPQVQELLARMAVLVGWDDHEVANDYAGADPALPREQRDAAYQAFFEYLPIRPQGIGADPFRTYRRFQFGANLEMFLVDERQYREPSAEEFCGGNPDPFGVVLGPLSRDGACIAALSKPRTMLGGEQFAWLTRALATSTAATKLVVNNVPVSYVGVLPYDRWDGYDLERRALLRFIDDAGLGGVAFLTTDIHANAYNPDVLRFFRENRGDYRLRGATRVPELIVGPIGNATAAQTLFGIAEAVERGASGGAQAGAGGDGVSALVDGAIDFYLAALKRTNRLAFIEPDRVSYAVIEVDADGATRFAFRGYDPRDAARGADAVTTFFEGAIDAPSPLAPACGPLPCGLPLLGAAGFVPAARWFVRRNSPRARS